MKSYHLSREAHYRRRHYRAKCIVFCVAAFLCSFQGNARQMLSDTALSDVLLSGTVRDAATGELLDAANVVVLRGNRAVTFTISNEKGEFIIPLNVSPDTLVLSVSMISTASSSAL